MHSLSFKHLKHLRNFKTKCFLDRNSDGSIKNCISKFFSTSDSKRDFSNLKNFLFLTKEEKDLKYEDASFYLEKEWKKLEEDKLNKKQDYMSKDLSDHQKKECDILIERILKFNAFEARYFSYVFNDLLQNISGVMPHRPNVFEKKKVYEVNISRPDDNPNHFYTQELLAPLIPFISSGYFSGGGGAAAVPSQKVDAEKTEEQKKPKEEEKIVKQKVDIKIITFDPAKKIALIKEVRAYLNLGLKEAKELVEKVPGLIKGNVNRSEAEEIQKKLEENGAKIELV